MAAGNAAAAADRTVGAAAGALEVDTADSDSPALFRRRRLLLRQIFLGPYLGPRLHLFLCHPYSPSLVLPCRTRNPDPSHPEIEIRNLFELL